MLKKLTTNQKLYLVYSLVYTIYDQNKVNFI